MFSYVFLVIFIYFFVILSYFIILFLSTFLSFPSYLLTFLFSFVNKSLQNIRTSVEESAVGPNIANVRAQVEISKKSMTEHFDRRRARQSASDDDEMLTPQTASTASPRRPIIRRAASESESEGEVAPRGRGKEPAKRQRRNFDEEEKVPRGAAKTRGRPRKQIMVKAARKLTGHVRPSDDISEDEEDEDHVIPRKTRQYGNDDDEDYEEDHVTSRAARKSTGNRVSSSSRSDQEFNMSRYGRKSTGRTRHQNNDQDDDDDDDDVDEEDDDDQDEDDDHLQTSKSRASSSTRATTSTRATIPRGTSNPRGRGRGGGRTLADLAALRRRPPSDDIRHSSPPSPPPSANGRATRNAVTIISDDEEGMSYSATPSIPASDIFARTPGGTASNASMWARRRWKKR